MHFCRGLPARELAFSSERDGGAQSSKLGIAVGVTMEQRDWELLRRQMRSSGLQRNSGLFGLVVLIVFFVGLALGSTLVSPRTAIQQIASSEQINHRF